MVLVFCALQVAINAGIPFIITENVEGKLIKETKENYLADFSEGVKKFNLSGKPEDYKKVLIKKSECVKE